MSELLNEMQQVSNAMNLRLRVQYADCASVCSSIIQTTLLAASLLLCAVGQAQTGTTVTWAGGNSSLGWADPANWNPQFSPLNNSEKSFTVIVPEGKITVLSDVMVKVYAAILTFISPLTASVAEKVPETYPAKITGQVVGASPAACVDTIIGTEMFSPVFKLSPVV